jgi:hypothetical protein
MYPYDFTPRFKGLNPEEVFVVMPFAGDYDKIYTELIDPAVALAGRKLERALTAYRTKGDLRTISGWIEVMEHLYTAQVLLGVLTNTVNANVQYELGIAHSSQPIQRQVLIAERGHKPAFDTKDLIFMEYSASSPGDSVADLAERIQTSVESWRVEQEAIVQRAIAKVSPFEFEIVMQWFSKGNFVVATSGTGPADYEKVVGEVHENDERYMQGVFQRHCDAIGRLQASGLLVLHTLAEPSAVRFTYYWTDLGNLVLVHFGLITKAERLERYESIPKELRRMP